MRKKSEFISKICVPLLSMVMIAGAIPHMTARAEMPPLENKQTPEESDAAAFRRIGEAFYNKYIRDKYQNPGGGTDVLTLEGIYALEYAMNKDLLSEHYLLANAKKRRMIIIVTDDAFYRKEGDEMEVMPVLDVPQLSMDLSMGKLQRDFGVAMLDMSLESAVSQSGALADMMRSSMELSVNPDIGGNIDIAV